MNSSNQLQNAPSLQSFTQFYLSQYLWGTPFRGEKSELAQHREKVSKIIFNMPLPLSLKLYLRQGVILREHAYGQMFQWEKVYQDFGPSDILMNSNENYFGPYYFTVSGHFNDSSWVKGFVEDTDKRIINRFCFACCYCFEDEIYKIWQQIRENGEVNYGRDIGRFRYRPVVSPWIHKLENKLDEYFRGMRTLIQNFFYFGLVEAVYHGHERATYYFWQHLPLDAKGYLIEKGTLYRLILKAAKSKYFKIVDFFQTQLSYEQKNDLLYMTMDDGGVPEVWWCLLEMPYTQSSALQEILHFPFNVPALAYASLLYNLANGFERTKLIMFKNAFRSIWEKISEDERLFVVRRKPDILTHLVKAKELDLASLIIKVMPDNVKEQYLLEHGIQHLSTLSARREYELLERYLCCFLVHLDKTLGPEMVLKNDLSVLQSPVVRAWVKSLPETEKAEVNKVIKLLKNRPDFVSKLEDHTKRDVVSLSYRIKQVNEKSISNLNV